MEANLASGLTAIAVLSGRDDSLPRAYEILMRSLDDMDDTDAYIGAARLVEAMGAKATRTGDIEGYDEALQPHARRLDVLARRPLRCVVARARLIRATHLAALSARALERRPAGPRRAPAPGGAGRPAQGVLEHSSPRGTVHALARLKFASLVDRAGGDLDAAIALCRASLRRLRLRSRLQRDFGRLVLCDLLIDRAPSATRRGRAAILARPCGCAAGCSAARRAAPRRCAASRAAAGRAQRRRGQDRPGVPPRVRRAVAACRAAAPPTSPPSGRRGPTGRRDADEAAEAHWCWIRAVADDARRRPLRAEKERRLAQFARPGGARPANVLDRRRPHARRGRGLRPRPRDAADRAHGARPRRPHRAPRRRGPRRARRALARGARGRSPEADRAGFADGWRRASGRRSSAVGASSAASRRSDQVALAELEQLAARDQPHPRIRGRRRAGRLRRPARRRRRGSARLRQRDRRGRERGRRHRCAEPAGRLAASRDDGELAAAGSRDCATAGDAGATERPAGRSCCRGCGSSCEPVAAQIAPGSLVTLVPLGALALLPLHAAALAPDAEGVWHDRDRGARLPLRAERARARPCAGAGMRARRRAAARPHRRRARRARRGDRCARAGTSRRRSPRVRHGRTDRPTPASRPPSCSAMDTLRHLALRVPRGPPARPTRSRAASCSPTAAHAADDLRPAAAAGRLAVLSACRTAAPDERPARRGRELPERAAAGGRRRRRVRPVGGRRSRGDAARPALLRRARATRIAAAGRWRAPRPGCAARPTRRSTRAPGGPPAGARGDPQRTSRHGGSAASSLHPITWAPLSYTGA